MKGILSGISKWWKTRTVGHRVILVLVGLLVVACSVYLDEGPKPWKEGEAPREEAGKRVRIDHYAVDGIYHAVVICLVATLLLVPFAGYFGRRLSAGFKAEVRPGPGKVGGWLLVGVVVVSGLLTCRYAVPRFDHSLWFDEELSMRRAIVGDHLRVGEDGLADRFGELVERPVRWEETLWFYESPNNHMLFSAWARLVHAMWPPDGSPEEPYFNTYALRAAALVPALLTLGVLAVLLSAMGMRVAAFALPPLLGLHPWFIRYASELRGYSLAMLLVSLCLLFFWKAAATGRWRWFGLYGLAQFLLLFTNPASLWYLVALNLAGVVGLLVRKVDWADRRTVVGRFLFANALGAMATLVMMMPLYLQLRLGHGEIAYGSEVFKNMGGAFLIGMRWVTWSETLGYVVSVQTELGRRPILMAAALLGFVTLAVLGLVALARRGGIYAVLVPVVLVPVPLFLIFTYLTGATLHYWYAVNMLPLLWIAVAVGIGYVAWLIGGENRRKESVAGLALILVATGAMWWAGDAQRRMQIEIPLERSRESVRATRDVLNPFDPRHGEVITVGFFKYTRAYDPGHYRVRSGEELRMMMARADEEKKPLFVNFALPDFARDHQPDIMELIDDPELFEEVGIFYAMEDTSTRWVVRYKPGSLEAKAGS